MNDTAIDHYKTAIQLLMTYKEKTGDEEYLQKTVHLHSLVGDSYNSINDDTNATEYYEKALKYNVLPFSMTDELHTNLSDLYKKNDQKYLMVIEHLKQSLNIKANNDNENDKNILDIASLNNDIGWHYYIIDDCDLALLHCQITMTLYEKHSGILNKNMDYANVLSSLDVICYKSKDYNKAWNYCWRSMSILKQDMSSIDDYDTAYACNYEILGNIYLSKNKKNLAYNCLKKALSLFKKQESNSYSNNIAAIEQSFDQKFNIDDVYYDVDDEFEWTTKDINSVEGLPSPPTTKRKKF
ncbi:unnamed protein product [Didymodactylos carnosus]|uniref:Uncharacterized protein n=1 Tax=Didymodactylos carnosus TaxID=1234261 RepID=A0A814LLC4_9BILA|nr:unnamed protein product [Didymodactylos carnosus]CAF1066601.1 unnamed protein product [Didymodactylos carnosus]CAF3663482.1 unnamed protein product [Didymodactylos carnosus]CAF3834199.1 unnamed protein product [Didymodactylos carnosus]